MHNDCFQPHIYKNNDFVPQSVEAIYKCLLDKNFSGEKEIITSYNWGEVLQLKTQSKGFVYLLNPESRDGLIN